jgi:hypothetical protein
LRRYSRYRRGKPALSSGNTKIGTSENEVVQLKTRLFERKSVELWTVCRKSPALSDEESVVSFHSNDAWYVGTWAVFIGFLQK